MLEIITTTLIAGAAAMATETASTAISRGAYTGLKNLIIAKFGRAKSAIEVIEDSPHDEDAKKIVARRLDEGKVADDPAISAAADKLLAVLKAAGVNVPAVTQTATGDGNVQIAGDGNKVTSNVSKGNSGINVQGSTVHGGITQGDRIAGDKVAGDKVAGDKIGRQVNTGGGMYVAGNVDAKGDFIGRDKVTNNYNTAPEFASIGNPAARALVPLLNTHFSHSEIEGLCFEMDIDVEQLRGQTKDELARSLASHVARTGRVDDLKKLMQLARPNLRETLK